ncbi:hypothetical protein WG926_14685 [Tistrella sp. BH-R2-4]|uniref:TIGR02588 family protein n=1 Tax=Tistrella arctica TaxID=3133430 RepID=A0ABU9YL75_9PROT
MTDGTGDGRHDPRPRGDAPDDDALTPPGLWEWAIGAIGAALLVAMVVWLLVQAITTPAGVPAIRVQPTVVAAAGEGWVVTFEAWNDGPRTASAVEIEGVITDGGAVVSRGRSRLDYLPPGSVRKGAILFDRDPHGLRVEMRALGYADP